MPICGDVGRTGTKPRALPLRSVHSIHPCFVGSLAPAWSQGIVALLVTDLEGFSTIVARLGDNTGLTWMRTHNELLRNVIACHGGREVAHTGDGMITCFYSIGCALHAARDAMRRLETLSRARGAAPWIVRMGVHAGEPLVADGRLFGGCVNTAVRVCTHARGGQILVTHVARLLADGSMFDFAEVEHVGLKGLTQQITLYELKQEAPKLGQWLTQSTVSP